MSQKQMPHTPYVPLAVGNTITSSTGNGYHVVIKPLVSGANPPAPGHSNDYYRWVSK